jgi:outer membrane protein assembly factor BamD (BamD/ComL family)
MNARKLFCLLLICASGIPVTAQSDISLWNELSSAYNRKFYPGVVRYAEQLTSRPDVSAFTVRALLYEGESLYYLGQFDAASRTLLRAASVTGGDTGNEAARMYWEGRIAFDTGQYEQALRLFHASAQKSRASNLNPAEYYPSALLYGARASMMLHDDKTAVPLFEYVIAHGTLYQMSDYESSCLQLLAAYNSGGNFQKTADLAGQLPLSRFSPAAIMDIRLCQADALNNLGMYRDSYDLYCSLITGASPDRAVAALQRAYVLSVEHPQAVGSDPGTVMANAADQFKNFPGFAASFKIRLGVDAYKKGNAAQAQLYFNQAMPDASPAEQQLAAIYSAELLAVNGTTRDASAAGVYLDTIAEKTALKPTDSLFQVYTIERARMAAFAGNWAACKDFSNALLKTGISQPVLYWSVLSRYKTVDFSGALQLLESAPSFSDNLPLMVVYGYTLARAGRTDDAANVFGHLEKRGAITDEIRIDYAKVLFLEGDFSGSYVQSAASSGAAAAYIAGLSAFNLRHWNDAARYFSRFLASASAGDQYVPFARFYCGYAQYSQGQFQNAYDILSSYAAQYQSGRLTWTARITAARAAVQLGKYDLAGPLAEKALVEAPAQPEKEESTLFCAGVYADEGQYDRALSVLAPYLLLHTDFGLQCQFQSALTAIQKKDYAYADTLYTRIAGEKSSSPVIEEASYRRAELYYTQARYTECIPLFDAYRASWPLGRFSDAALFFSADSLDRTGSVDRALLYYLQLVQRSKTGAFTYSAEKNMVAVYRSIGDYSGALGIAQRMTADFPDQASADHISDVIKELNLLNKGADAAIVKLQEAYNRAGGEKTAEGRSAGTQLAAALASSQSTQAQAVALAETLFAVQKKNSIQEHSDAAKNALLLGAQYRLQNENKKAAQFYLAAAEYYRMTAGSESDAARSLYGAVEAFDAAGMYADSRDVAETLSSLYPDSRQAAAAKTLITRQAE